MAMRILLTLSLPLFLAGCIFGGETRQPPKRPSVGQGVRPGTAGPVTLNLPTSKETQQCYAELSRAGVRFSPLPDRDYGGGCTVVGAVQLIDIQMPVSGLKAMRCPLARNFIGWIRNAAVPASREILGSELVRVESMGTYACRGIVGGSSASSLRVSQHGLGNAVDISAFILADGRRINVLNHWSGGTAKEREFLRVVQRSACRRFTTVLGPEYNSAHRDHFHFDMGGSSFCK